MALHEHFRDYTVDEVTSIIINHCQAHKCPYLRRVVTGALKNNSRNAKFNAANKCCMYIDVAGKMRGCMPDECTHYLDKDVKKKVRPETIIPSREENLYL